MFTFNKMAMCALLATATASFSPSSQAAVPIAHWTLANGARIYLASVNTLPIVDLQIDFDAGSRRDPAAQTGLAGAMADMVQKGIDASKQTQTTRESYAEAMDENALGEAWADLGASFNVGAGPERLSFTLRTLSDPALLDRAVQLASRQIGAPSFPAPVWLNERDRIGAAIKEANTKPATVVARAFAQAVYGAHPYGRETTADTLARISVGDLRARYASLVLPCRAKLSIVGAVTRAQAESIATKLLSRLPAGGNCAAMPPVVDIAPLAAAKDERIAFESAQAHVLIGQPGYKRSDPDHFALTLGNYILGGGGFVSRLTEEVREKRGLSYSVYSYFAPGLEAGAFRIGLQTRPDQVNEAVKLSREVLAKFVADGPTEVELKAAKDNLIGGFPLLLDSNRKLLGNIANIAWNDLPLDYLETWTARMNAITVTDIKAAFARKLQPERMVTVVVGGKS